jgi:hypothetical protein
MSSATEFGVSKRGRMTLIHNNYEFWKDKENKQGQTVWVCTKNRVFKCPARLKTENKRVIGNSNPDHNHSGNVATALARKAIGKMKEHMTETIATPSASQGSVVVRLPEHVQMALPKRASLSRMLRRHCQIKSMASNGGAALPPIPTDMTFDIPGRYQDFLLHDSGPGGDRLLIFGDRELLGVLGRAELWISDGTFKVVPGIFFQLYSIPCRCVLPSRQQESCNVRQNDKCLKSTYPSSSTSSNFD